MILLETDFVPISIKFTLYSSDYFENMLVQAILKECDYIKSDGYYSIKVSEFRHLIETQKKLLGEISKLESMSDVFDDKNTIQLLWEVVTHNPNLRVLIFNVVSASQRPPVTSMLFGEATSPFYYSVVEGVVNLFDILTPKELETFNKIMISNGVLSNNYLSRVSSFFIKCMDFFDLLLSEHFANYPTLIETLMSYISPKLDIDNTTLLIVTDYDLH